MRCRGNVDLLLTFSSQKSVGLKSPATLSLSTQLCHKGCIQQKVRVLVSPAEPCRHTNHTDQVFAFEPIPPIDVFCVPLPPGEQPRGNLISDVGGKHSE